MTATLLIYGATGYTGRLVASHALGAGLRPVLAGRTRRKVEALASALGLEGRTFTLDQPAAIRDGLQGIDCLLNVAGPFAHTARPLINACLQAGVHYLDVTGEIDVFEMAAGLDARARDAGLMLLPGAGFDVVPSDCLAAMVAAEVEQPVALELGILALGGPSQGTAKTAVESAGAPTRVRRNGQIVTRRPGSLARTFDFGRGPRRAVAVSWGDVATAYYTTRIPDITVYFPAGGLGPVLRAARWLGPLLRTPPVRALLKKTVELGPAGPDAQTLETGKAILVAEARDAAGRRASARLVTPNGYKLTALAAVDIAGRVLAGDWQPGFQTPALAYGSRYVLSLPGCRLEEMATPSAASG